MFTVFFMKIVFMETLNNYHMENVAFLDFYALCSWDVRTCKITFIFFYSVYCILL